MEQVAESRVEQGHGGHYVVAVTGSGNSEYLIRWTDSASRHLNARWTALHVRVPGQTEGQENLERNLELARSLGAETVTLTDNDVASCLVRYARIKEATTLVIGKTDDEGLPFLGRRPIMESILRESADLDVVILRGKTPVPSRKVRLRGRFFQGWARGLPLAFLGLLAVTSLGFLGQPALGYRSISILYLLTIITLPFFCGRLAVFAAAAASALLLDFFFIPPKLTFTIGSLEDVLMFIAFFLAAFVGGYLTSRLKEKESALALRERRMAFLYGYTRAISRVRGAEEIVQFTENYLLQQLRLRSIFLLKDAREDLKAVARPGEKAGGVSELPGFDPDRARRCLESGKCVADGERGLYIPLECQESLLGVLYATGGGTRTVQGEVRELLSALAGNMALALERELLSEENERNKMAGESARLSKILLNHVSHELRTPLTTIKGSVSGLLEDDTAEDPEMRRSLLTETMIAANKLNVLVEDLLAMSRLEAGRLQPHPELTYVSELIGVAQSGLSAELAGRALSLDETAQDFEIVADPVLMVQVFRNILRNFAEYTPPGSRLHVEACLEPGGSILRFSDNGPGVPDRELPLLFDTFYRGTGGAAKQGCGLGLSICRGIVEAHGGKIGAGRSREGGLVITVHLPGRGTS